MTDLFQECCPTCNRPYENETIANSEFEDAWVLYPKRNGKKVGKAKAETEYKKARKRVSKTVLHGAIKSYAASCGDFPKDMERWLRDKRWLDEPLGKEQNEMDALKWWADLINSGKPVFAKPGSDLRAALVAGGYVTEQRMKEIE